MTEKRAIAIGNGRTKATPQQIGEAKVFLAKMQASKRAKRARTQAKPTQVKNGRRRH